TPAEKAETQKLNEEQLQADASPGPAMVPNSQPSGVQPGSEPAASATQKQSTPPQTNPPQP
ncbi:MAG: hypothetical protein KGI68_09550, partial [Alphaproteobacteria bacterium]|nr:hypothetical protein [Alphaproteobacteria bacterium]